MTFKGKQVERGVALEWALAACLARRLEVQVETPRGRAYFDADAERQILEAASEIATTHILGIEKGERKSDIRNRVEMPPTAAGEHGDPRDIIVSASGRIYGISVKRNNNTLKNSRVQFGQPDFGESWKLGMSVSPSYENAIRGVETYTAQGKADGKCCWREFGDLHLVIYEPLIHAFMAEFDRMAQATPAICGRFVQYMMGAPDYYKVMVQTKGRHPKVQVQGINLAGTLACPKLILPTKLFSSEVKGHNTALLSFDKGWAFSLRIHTADEKITRSLKWDVKMIGNPSTLYTHHQDV